MPGHAEEPEVAVELVAGLCASGAVGGSAMMRSYSGIEIRSRAASISPRPAAAMRSAARSATTPEKNSLVQPLPYENKPMRWPIRSGACACRSPASPRYKEPV